ncbi:hypothetical protein ACWGPD_36865 [Streptomyces hirsutus]|uniref:hypothetical protein n=1 Tax=Streptomyces hirsutus TaxID=35620 RepID=UPI00362DA020
MDTGRHEASRRLPQSDPYAHVAPLTPTTTTSTSTSITSAATTAPTLVRKDPAP